MDNQVNNYIDLFKLKNVPDGAIYHVKANNKYYQKTNHSWKQYNVKIEGNGPEISLYDLNQGAIAQMTPWTAEQINNYIGTFNEYANNHIGENHFMLLSNQLKYYTVFAYRDGTSSHFGDSVAEILNGLIVYDISYQEDQDSYEIWAKLTDEDAAPEVFYLFPYERGVVYYD